MNGRFFRARVTVLLLTPVLLASGCSSTALDEILAGALEPSQALDRETVIAGLREALEVSAERTVERTARIDGFLANELIRIAIPDELDKLASALRRLGLGGKVDELEIQMNRAAEEAAGEAREIFWDEIRSLTFPDAVAILEGGGTAATDFLEERTGGEIRSRFEPVVVETMNEVGLARLYADLAETYNRLPLVTTPAINLEDYVTEEALEGLFTVLREEEARIREDPLARTTDLLRRVFGRERATQSR